MPDKTNPTARIETKGTYMTEGTQVLLCEGFGQDPLDQARQHLTVARSLQASNEESADAFEARLAEMALSDPMREYARSDERYARATAWGYQREAENWEKHVAALEAASLTVERAAGMLAYKLTLSADGEAWARLKARVDGICARDKCTEYVVAEDYWTPERRGLAFELCPEHLAEALADEDANRRSDEARLESAAVR